ncbi:MAG: peptidylprolyl isomerase [Bacteroidetes bacterium]|nr:peptidylprolyl isomerase [Bacteroidota bacterium]
MKTISKLSIIVLISAVVCSAQDDTKTVAHVGGENISAEEFKFRYEFMPHFTDKQEEADSSKRKFLYSLIAEKLWAAQAQKEKLDTTENVRYSMSSLENLLLRDELYRKAVMNNVKITAAELKDGLWKFSLLLSIRMIASTDSAEAFKLYSSIKKSADFDSLLQKRLEYQKQIEPYKITFCDLEDEHLESVIYKLKEGQITEPIRTKKGWIIAKLIKREDNPRNSDKVDVRRNIVSSKLTQRKSEILSGIFLDKILGGLHVNVDYGLFSSLATGIKKVLEKQSSVTSDSSKQYEIDEETTNQVLNSFDGKDLHAKFVKLPIKDTSLKSFIYYFSHQHVKFSSTDLNSIIPVLHKYVRSFIENEVLANEARKEGLESSPTLKADLSRWQQNYLAELALEREMRSIKVSDEEMQNFYKQKYHVLSPTPQANVLEIVNKDPEAIETVFKQLEKGADFRQLAKKYTQRIYTKRNSGELGWFSINEAGEIGKIASKMKIGQVYGPIKVPGGYSIIKLINKRILKDTSAVRFDEVKESIRMQLSLKKFDEQVESKTIKLAREYGIRIDEKVYSNTEVLPTRMFTMRYLGFGGKMAALPLTVPLYNWYYKYQKDKSNLP